MTLTLEETLLQLESLGDENRRLYNVKNGAGDNQFGVKLGDIRKLAKMIKTNHKLGMQLWKTGNMDAQLLAILLLKPKMLSGKDMDQMVQSATVTQVADWLNAYVVNKHPDNERLRQGWMTASKSGEGDPMTARAGWNLTSIRVAKSPKGINIPALLERIETEMVNAAPEVQWTMNNTLVEIGIHFPGHRKQAIAIGETLGVYRDFPVSKGCTSPFAPIWINEMVSRQG